jgi:hypothetical protein
MVDPYNNSPLKFNGDSSILKPDIIDFRYDKQNI